MKDESLHIFRSLETVGAGGFDTIVGAAVATYGSLRAPGEAQARDFGRLVVAVWDKISPDSRRSLAAALSKSPRVPREVVDRLIAEPVEISAPFLMASPALTDADLRRLEDRGDPRLARILAGRLAEPSAAAPPGPVRPAAGKATPPTPAAANLRKAPPLPETARASFEPPADARPAPPQPLPATTTASGKAEIEAPPLVPDLASRAGAGIQAEDRRAAPRQAENRPDEPEPGSRLRDTLRRLALPGRRRNRSGGGAPTLGELVAFAVRQDAGSFYDALGGLLSLAPATLTEIEGEADGTRLAVALKALGAGTADALTILMMMKPEIGLDVGAFERMTRFYGALKAEDVKTLARAAPGPGPALRSSYEDAGGVRQPEERRSFGRRERLPAGTGRTSINKP